MGNSLSFLWMLAQTIFALLLVCGLAYLIFRVLLPRLTGNFSSNNMVRVVDRVGLEARKNLYVVEVTGRWLLISVSENGAQLISELDPTDAARAEQEVLKNRGLSPPNAAQFGNSFADKLSEVMRGWKGGKR